MFDEASSGLEAVLCNSEAALYHLYTITCEDERVWCHFMWYTRGNSPLVHAPNMHVLRGNLSNIVPHTLVLRTEVPISSCNHSGMMKLFQVIQKKEALC